MIPLGLSPKPQKEKDLFGDLFEQAADGLAKVKETVSDTVKTAQKTIKNVVNNTEERAESLVNNVLEIPVKIQIEAEKAIGDYIETKIEDVVIDIFPDIDNEERIDKLLQLTMRTPMGPAIYESIGLMHNEYNYLSFQERLIVTPEVYSYFGNIKDLIGKPIDISAEQVFDVVYRTMPSVFVNSFTDCFLRNQSLRRGLMDEAINSNGEITVEMILKFFMSYSANVERIGKFGNLDIPLSLKVWNKIVEKLQDWIPEKSDVLDDLIVELIPVKPILLAALWAIMIVGLTEYYCKTDLADADLKEISKLVLSIVMSLLVGFTGYMHKGGVIGGVTSPTKYLRYAYMGYDAVKDTGLIPSNLRFPALDGFSNLSRELRVSTGEGLNMMYTFRVGDTMLVNLEEDKVVSGEAALSILKSLWPLPLMDQVNKMYRLYTERKIYSL